ncbi:hypothetical protein ZHAS_00008792 [Anopheles sinensis]|uniref:Uncharacterized protein n=1 Tax=Anopheles sinensis TaxID=74873 RepID=A0A084VTC5_ANOSI|nr:hypothetical protein ZHAS_00008792 [Anopheles sinensis]
MGKTRTQTVVPKRRDLMAKSHNGSSTTGDRKTMPNPIRKWSNRSGKLLGASHHLPPNPRIIGITH